MAAATGKPSKRKNRINLGIAGLHLSGGDLARRLRRAEVPVAVYGRDLEANLKLEQESGTKACRSLAELVAALATPRIVWLAVPAGEPAKRAIDELAMLLASGDLIVDGSDGHFKDAVQHSRVLSQRGIGYVDAGVSGAAWGLQHGFVLALGGEAEVVQGLEPVLRGLATGSGKDWLHCGPAGSGHFVKMVQNQIERSITTSFAEGMELLKGKNYFRPDTSEMMHIWRHAGVISSGLAALVDEFLQHASPSATDGSVPGTGATPAITLALTLRLSSRMMNEYMQRLQAMKEAGFGISPGQKPPEKQSTEGT